MKASSTKAKKKTKSPAKTNAKARGANKGSSKNAGDIVELILRDHKPLKKLIKVMKGEKASIAEKRRAFEEFAPLLKAHAKPEEESLYVHMKGEEDLRMEAFEGDTEHAIADQLAEEIQGIDDEDVWVAKVKVLAELVEHHIEEEEEEMLPDVKKEMDLDERIAIGQEYLQLRSQFQDELPMAA